MRVIYFSIGRLKFQTTFFLRLDIKGENKLRKYKSHN